MATLPEMQDNKTVTSPPKAASAHDIDWLAAIGLILVHLIACAAFIPWTFHWAGVLLGLAGLFVFGLLGVNLGYHRLLSHRSFKCSLWFEHLLAVLGVCSLDKTPGQFVALHRAHHEHTDEQGDPHSPLVTFFWAHMGWLFVERSQMDSAALYYRYARDIYRDPFYARLERNFLWVWVHIAHMALFFAAGFAAGSLGPAGSAAAGVQLGTSFVVWGVFVRTVLAWHITWSVNSVGHTWGYRNYETRGNSRNNIFVGLISNGEGWHNNHHADQRAAAHGHKWWELDLSYQTLLLLRRCGLVWDLVPVGGKGKTMAKKLAG